MRADLIGLQWLNLEQALQWLREEASIQLSKQGLISQCDAGQCLAYMNVDGLKGICSEGVSDEQGEWFNAVYGVGKSQVLNPMGLVEAEGRDEVQLYIAGEVSQIKQAGANTYNNVDWVLTIRPEHCHLIFKTSDIVALAEMLGSVAPAADSVKPSQTFTIAALLELLTEKGRPVYNQEAIIDALIKRYPGRRGFSVSNLQKIFADSKAAAAAEKS